MATIIIILLAVVIIYLFYAIFGSKSEGESAIPTQAKTSAKAETAKPKQQPKPKQEKVASSKKAATEDKSKEVTALSNPKTGEEAPVPNNYRFAKRWIKEALVEEGLLAKIYKNNELDDAANKKVKEALGKLTAIKKYQA